VKPVSSSLAIFTLPSDRLPHFQIDLPASNYWCADGVGGHAVAPNRRGERSTMEGAGQRRGDARMKAAIYGSYGPRTLSLCPRCHAKVERTQMVLSEMNPILLELWREKHPQGLEQFALDFEERNESSPYPNLLICLDEVSPNERTSFVGR